MIKLLFTTLLLLGSSQFGAFAQTTKVFVASTGNDSNDGGRATPKRSFQGAHDAVAAGGEIVALDTAGYGPVAITKSVSIIVPPGVSGFVTTAKGKTGISIQAPNGVVTLRGLIIEGNPDAPGSTGIDASTVKSLVVEDTIVRYFTFGINATGHNSQSSQLVVRGGAVQFTNFGIALSATLFNNGRLAGHVIGTELVGNQYAIYSVGLSGSPAYMFTSRCKVTQAVNAFYSEGFGTVIADSCSVTNVSSVFHSTGSGTTYTRNNTVVSYSDFGSPGAFAGQAQ